MNYKQFEMIRYVEVVSEAGTVNNKLHGAIGMQLDQKEATMADVARLAKVGTMTVSRVLNRSAHVNAATATRVHRAIESLQYRPNEAARTLRGLKSRTIGLLVPSLADPFFATCAHNINLVAQQNGYSMILTTSDNNPDVEYAQAQWMLQRNIEGLLVVPVESQNCKLQDHHFDRIPIVAFDSPADIARLDCVLVDNFSGAVRATEHLIEHGHKSIHYLGDLRALSTIQARLDGYRRAMMTAGLSPVAKLDCTSPAVVHAAIKGAMEDKNPPTAFFCANNSMAKYLMMALYELRIRVPEQAAIIGFDDVDMAAVLQPRLTVIRQPVEDMAAIAANLLFDRLKTRLEDRPHDSLRRVLPVELVLRSSCGCTG